MTDSNEVLFAPEDISSDKQAFDGSWKILIVDDEEDVHKVTRLALEGFVYKNRNLTFLNTYSGKDSEKVIADNPDIALILLDVVMESEHAGLHLVKFIRETLNNKLSRIVLRTGQAGQAPEKEVIRDYEINDYKSKTELTNLKLFTTIISALRSYETLCEIESYKNDLEIKIFERTKEVEKQKEIINQKNISMTDSIRYASYIQNAMLTPLSEFSDVFSESFIMSKPRDIVSGDFYWLFRRDSKIFFAVGDCTGHGVPGALMSMLAISNLNDIVMTNKYITANELLNELREKIIKSLRQENCKPHSVQDGLDIALCILNKDSGDLQFSGANNPLIIINTDIDKSPHFASVIQLNRTNTYLSGSDNNGLLLIEGDKMPVGVYFEAKTSFKNINLTVKNGECLYLFSDGFVDQFGGEHHKKFLSKRLKEALLKIAKYPMLEQKEKLNKIFNEWKGECDQIDDVTIMGIRIS